MTRRHQSLKEHDIRRLTEALLYSRVMYTLPYVRLTPAQQEQLNRALRPAARLALGVPCYTPF